MREFRPYGSVRGARSDARPYRDQVGGARNPWKREGKEGLPHPGPGGKGWGVRAAALVSRVPRRSRRAFAAGSGMRGWGGVQKP